jgi:tRNA 5-methylaminomethyl-2-thiouridine biosynthesis bifunctional protein
MRLPSPRLSWSPQRAPRSDLFNDTYYSREGGLAEKRHVFLGGCQLPGGWRDTSPFAIGELGFGTGLTFLATWEMWRRNRSFGSRLHYIAVEGHPLSLDELRECHLPWGELRHLAAGLQRAYPPPQPGYHRVFLDDGQVTLTFLFGRAAAMLKTLEAHVDAWFLDGFAPDRNPDMWSGEVLGEVARLSKPGARIATYTVVGDVCQTLSASGFEVHKVPGFGAKREMLRGAFTRGAPAKSTALQPWFAHAPAARLRQGRAAVIGAGLAGANAARALKRRGWSVTVVDAGETIAAGASGNAVGVLMPRLTAAPNHDGRFYAAAWPFALQTLEALADRGLPLLRDRGGVLQLAVDADEDHRQAAIMATPPLPEPYLFRVSAAEASEIAGVKLPYAALFFPQGGWLSTALTCRALLDGVEVLLERTVTGLRRSHGQWTLVDAYDTEIVTADIVVIANAMGAANLPQSAWLPLQARLGQISMVPPTDASQRLHCVLGYGGYLTPQHRGRHCVGATFDWIDDPTAAVTPTDHGHRRNLEDLAQALPGLIPIDTAAVDGRAAVRCTLPDHLPAAGPLPDDSAYLRDYAELRHGHSWARFADASYQPGLYVLAGLGSRGLVSAPLAAEILASQIGGEPWPVERDLVTALHPGRFLVRDLKRLRA